MGLEAIGDQIQHLVASGERLDSMEAKALCDYVKAACAVSKNSRDEALVDKMAELSDADLERLVADEVQRNPEMLKRILDRAKSDARRIS